MSYVAILASVVVAGLLVAVIFHSVLGLLGYAFPWNTFLFMPEDRFNDWYNSVSAAVNADPYFERRTTSAYFPFAYVLLLIGARASSNASVVVYLIVSLALLVGAIACTLHRARAAGLIGVRHGEGTFLLLFGACLLSYPVLFSLDRGNIDLWIAAMCMFFVASLGARQEILGFVALGVAIALKGYPAAFLVLALGERKYGSMLLSLALAAGLTVLALASMDGGMVRSFNGWLENLGEFHRRYVLGSDSMFATSDPYSGIRSALFVSAEHIARFLPRASVLLSDVKNWSPPILRAYSVLSFAFAVGGTIFVLAVPARRWQRIMAICLVAMLFPNVANDYKLCILLPGVLALVIEEDRSRRGLLALLLVCMLMIPKSYYFFAGPIGITNFVNPTLLVALAVCVLADRDAWRRARLFDWASLQPAKRVRPAGVTE
jgi:Glycosyltransferase family 87